MNFFLVSSESNSCNVLFVRNEESDVNMLNEKMNIIDSEILVFVWNDFSEFVDKNK